MTSSPLEPDSGSPPGRIESERLRNRERRLAPIVEAFLRQVRTGGSLDPESFLSVVSSDLRGELEPLLLGVLRLEQASEGLDSRRRLHGGHGGDQER